MALPTFITRWRSSAAAERANYQLFLSELCNAGVGDGEVGALSAV
jgi:hypothetical protein